MSYLRRIFAHPSYLIKHVKICNASRRNAWRVGLNRSLNGNIEVFAS